MTVADLIAHLSECDPDMDVFYDGYSYIPGKKAAEDVVIRDGEAWIE